MCRFVVGRPVSNKAPGFGQQKTPPPFTGSEVSEISCVNQNPTAAPLSSSAVSSSRLFAS
jgi:hypothetical protein